MYGCIIIDDEVRGLSTMRQMINRHCPNLEILSTCDSADAGKQAIETLHPDLIFTDIVMPGKNALQMLSELTYKDFSLIFVTAHLDYALKAFQYSAVDYLLKPVDEEMLTIAVERAIKKLQDQTMHQSVETLQYNMQATERKVLPRLCIQSIKGFNILEIEDIIYIEAQGNYSKFHLTNGQSVTTSKSILEYDQILAHNLFFRIHKSYLINLRHIKEYARGEGGQVLMTNGLWLEVSRRRKEAFIFQVKQSFKTN